MPSVPAPTFAPPCNAGPIRTAGSHRPPQELLASLCRGLGDDAGGANVRVLPPKARDVRFEKSMGEALKQQNEKLEMQEVRAIHCVRPSLENPSGRRCLGASPGKAHPHLEDVDGILDACCRR